jgi:hypothetical protein
MRQAGAEELGNRNATLELVAWLKDNRQSGQIDRPLVERLAEQLMAREHRLNNSASAAELRAGMAWLTKFARNEHQPARGRS